MDPASALAALVASLQLMLSEIRRRSKPETDRVCDALLSLEFLLSCWIMDAHQSNLWAERWADGLPESLDEAPGLRTIYLTQAISFASVQVMFSEEIRPFGAGPIRRGSMTLEDVLRVYAPEVLQLAPLLVDRQRQLKDGVVEQLESRAERPRLCE